MQAGLLGQTTRRLGEHRGSQLCVLLMLAGFLGLAACSQVWQLCLVMLPLSAGGLMFTIMNTSQLTKAVPSSQLGTILAIDMSLGSGLRMLSPAAATALLARFGFYSIGLGAAALVALTLLVYQLGLCTEAQAAKPEGKEE